MRLLASLLSLLVVAGCTSDSAFPTPTGKGTFRALNAIEASPALAFFIEEVAIANISYKGATAPSDFDDFEYTFNVEALLTGDTTPTRVASILQKIDADQDYTFVLTGAFDSPTIMVWTAPTREFEGSETVFDIRFAHTAAGTGAVDVYFAAEGVAPVLGEERGTLAFGEILDPLEFAGGDFVITFTTSGDPNDVLFQSSSNTYPNASTIIAPLFDGNEQDTSPYAVTTINTLGGIAALNDSRFSPTARFFQADMSMGPTDVFDDEMLTNPVLMNHVFGDITADIDVSVGTTTFTYTDAGNPGATTLTFDLTAVGGSHYNIVALNGDPDRSGTAYIPDRQSILSIAKTSLFNAAFNQGTVDFYVVESGVAVADVNPTAAGLGYSLLASNLAFVPGSYDLYVTVAGEKSIIAGPVAVNLAAGDVLDLIALDTVDPATAELRIVPAL